MLFWTSNYMKTAPNSGRKQTLELGLITLNVNSLNVMHPTTVVTKNELLLD